MVMVAPGAAVPPLGFWLITWPAGEDEVASVLVSTLKPLDCRVVAAWSCCWPTTFGTATGACPLDTNSVTMVFAATLLPSWGLELMTMFGLTVLEFWKTTVDRRCWALICACATATFSPFTSGTAYVLPAPASR